MRQTKLCLWFPHNIQPALPILEPPPPDLDGRPMLRVCFPEISGFGKVRKLFEDAGLGDAVINPKWRDGWTETTDTHIIMHSSSGGIFKDDPAYLYFDLPYLEQPEQLQKLRVLERTGSRTGRARE